MTISNPKRHLKWSTLVLFTFLMLTFGMASASAPCLSYSTSMQVGQTQTITTNQNAQAYYWTVSGPLVIVGSNTNSSVTVQATGTGTGTVTLVYFKDGECTTCSTGGGIGITAAPCPYEITEYIPMCYSTSANCLQKRGHYVVKDCNGNTVIADWEVTPNNNGNCIYYGCNTPGTGRLTTGGFKPIPMCAWAGNLVTVKAYAAGTNNLLDSYVTMIQDCDDIFGKGGSGGNKVNASGESIALELPANGPVEIVAINLQTGAKIDLHREAGARGSAFSYTIPTGALAAGNYYFIRVQQNGKLLETRKIRMGGQ